MSAPLAIGRRGFLGRTVAALAAAGAVNVTAIAATRPDQSVTELPELIDAGQRLDGLLIDWRAAQASRLEARALAERLVPPVPDEIVCRGPMWAACTEEVTDVEGKQLGLVFVTDESGKKRVIPPQQIIDATALRRQIEGGRIYCDGRTKFGKRVKRMIAVAEQYEAERAAAIERSGIDVHIERCTITAMRIQAIARDVAELEPLTMLGASVQARALVAWAEAHDNYDKGWAQLVLGVPLARSIARLTVESA